MKKINLFLSTLIVALVILVIGGATITPVSQFNASALQPAYNADGRATGTQLFDAKGRYQVDLTNLKDGIKTGTVYQFFGYDWYVVYINETQNVATFWMVDPYTKSIYNNVTQTANGIISSGVHKGENIWSNGYSGADWAYTDTNNNPQSGSLGSCVVRDLLSNKATELKNNYSNFEDKVRAGAIEGTNDTIVQTENIKLYYATESNNWTDGQSARLTAKFGLDSSDYLWLPSANEIESWNVHENLIKWTYTTISSRAWLRSADSDSRYAHSIASSKVNGTYNKCNVINQEYGVRPAIHLDITNIADEYQDHIDNPANGGKNWWDDDWLKAMFLTVCVVGIVGLVMVVIGVVAKVRKAEKNGTR